MTTSCSAVVIWCRYILSRITIGSSLTIPIIHSLLIWWFVTVFPIWNCHWSVVPKLFPWLIFIIPLQNICMCIYIYMYVCMCIYIYIYTTHTYHYIYIHSIPFRSPVLLMFVLLNFPKAGAWEQSPESCLARRTWQDVLATFAPCFQGKQGFGGFLSHGGTQIRMVYFMENSINIDDFDGIMGKIPPNINGLFHGQSHKHGA